MPLKIDRLEQPLVKSFAAVVRIQALDKGHPWPCLGGMFSPILGTGLCCYWCESQGSEWQLRQGVNILCARLDPLVDRVWVDLS